jgi:hypothetical protein
MSPKSDSFLDLEDLDAASTDDELGPLPGEPGPGANKTPATTTIKPMLGASPKTSTPMSDASPKKTLSKNTHPSSTQSLALFGEGRVVVEGPEPLLAFEGPTTTSNIMHSASAAP